MTLKKALPAFQWSVSTHVATMVVSPAPFAFIIPFSIVATPTFEELYVTFGASVGRFMVWVSPILRLMSSKFGSKSCLGIGIGETSTLNDAAPAFHLSVCSHTALIIVVPASVAFTE